CGGRENRHGVVARRAVVAGAVALVVIAIGVAVSRVPRTPVTVIASNTVRSLAIVAAIDSSDTTRRWLERGIAMEVERALRGVSGLRVVSATTTARVPRRRLAELLNVGSTLETRLTGGPNLELHATLRGEGDSTRLNRHYATTPEDLIEAEDAIAPDVAHALRAR